MAGYYRRIGPPSQRVLSNHLIRVIGRGGGVGVGWGTRAPLLRQAQPPPGGGGVASA